MKKMHGWLSGLGLMLGASLFWGCSTVTQLGTQIAQETGVISESQASAVSRNAANLEKSWQDITPEQEYYIGRAVTARVLESYPGVDRPHLNDYLNLLGQSLAQSSTRPETYGGYRFLLVDSNEINAFAAPGGLILVSRGMVNCCSSEEELAAVLAHEIAHVEQNHGLRAIRQGRLTGALTMLAADSAKEAGGADLATLTSCLEESVGDIVMTLTTTGYSRSQERDADAAALIILRNSGYPDSALATMLERMATVLPPSGGSGFAKTHPPVASRLAAIRPLLRSSPAVPQARRQARFALAVQPEKAVE